jgi:fluoride exporter
VVAGVSGLATWLAVAAAGAVGSLARFGVHEAVDRRLGRRFPFGTLVVNLSGALALGVLVGATLTGDAYRIAGTGLLGAYTTFSTWMLETERLAESDARVSAVANVVVSVVAGVAAVALGRRLGAL